MLIFLNMNNFLQIKLLLEFVYLTDRIFIIRVLQTIKTFKLQLKNALNCTLYTHVTDYYTTLNWVIEFYQNNSAILIGKFITSKTQKIKATNTQSNVTNCISESYDIETKSNR